MSHYQSMLKNWIKEIIGQPHSPVDNIIMVTGMHADEILTSLLLVLDKCGEVSVLDLYKIVGDSPNAADMYFGWKDLSTAKVVPNDKGYLLVFPKPEYLLKD